MSALYVVKADTIPVSWDVTTENQAETVAHFVEWEDALAFCKLAREKRYDDGTWREWELVRPDNPTQADMIESAERAYRLHQVKCATCLLQYEAQAVGDSCQQGMMLRRQVRVLKGHEVAA